MKFKYDISDSSFKYLNLAKGIYLKKKILKNYKNKKYHGLVFYVTMGILLLLLVAFFSGFFLAIINLDTTTEEKVIKIFSTVLTCMIAILVFVLFDFIINYITFKRKRAFKGTLMVDEKGIEDAFSGITFKVEWEKVDSVFIVEDLVVIICNSNIIQDIIAKISNNKKFINIVKKYSKETLVVDATDK